MTALLKNITPFLSKVLPIGAALKGLSQSSPKMSEFILNSLSTGYTAEEVVSFIRDQLMPEGQKIERQRLESSRLLPEEKLSLKGKREADQLPQAIGAGIGLASGIGGLVASNQPQGIPLPGAGMRNPSQPPPPPPPNAIGQQAPQGLPSLGAAPQKPSNPIQMGPTQPGAAIQMGMGNQNQANPINSGLAPFDFLAQYSPDLAKQVLKYIQNGYPADAVGTLVKGTKNYSQIVKQIEKDNKIDFNTLLLQLFKNNGNPTQNQQQQQSSGLTPEQKAKFDEALKGFMGAIGGK